MQVRVKKVPRQLKDFISVDEVITIEPQIYMIDTCIHVGNIRYIKRNGDSYLNIIKAHLGHRRLKEFFEPL